MIVIKDMSMPEHGYVEILIYDDGLVLQTGQSYRDADGTLRYQPLTPREVGKAFDVELIHTNPEDSYREGFEK